MSSTSKSGTLRRKSVAQQVSDLLPDVLAEVLVRRSGMTIDLIAGWEEIVGPDYATVTLPEKILWPRRTDDTDPFKPGTLVVACEGPKALFFQHEADQTLARINHFFGFEAVTKLKIVQKPVHVRPKPERKAVHLSDEDKSRIGAVLAQIEDPKLRETLGKFGRGVYSRKYEQK